MAAPTVPAALDALVALCRTSTTIGAADPPVTVFDGPPLTDLPDDYIAIGLGSDDNPAVTGEIGWAAFGKIRGEEYAVICQVSSASGDEEMKPVRDRAFAIWAAFAAAVLADPTLGGVLIKALVGTPFNLVQDQTGGGADTAGGAGATIDFNVVCTSHI